MKKQNSAQNLLRAIGGTADQMADAEFPATKTGRKRGGNAAKKAARKAARRAHA